MTTTVRKSITLDAELPRVWDALTNPDTTRQYFYNCEVISDWIIGHPIIYRETTPEHFTERIHGTLIGYVPRQMFAYAYPSPTTGQIIKVAFYLMLDKDAETELTIIQECGNDEQAYHDAMRAWDYVLDGLKFTIEA